MAKVVLNDVGSILTAANTINANNQRIEDAIENTLSRDGTAPNEMNANLDMNNYRIYNLPVPVTDTEPVRKYELDNFPARLEGWTPELAIISDGVRLVQQVVDWFGGQGVKPAVGLYVGATGFTLDIAQAIDIRGAQGPSGSVVDGDKGDVVVSGSGTIWTVDSMVGDSGAGGAKGLVPAPAAGDAAAGKVLGASGTWVTGGGGSGNKNYIGGLDVSNVPANIATHIGVSAGEAVSDGSPAVLLTLGSAYTKNIAATWAVGTGNGSLDTGSIGNGTYYLWLIQRSDTGVVDLLTSRSATSPTMPANYDRKAFVRKVYRVNAKVQGFAALVEPTKTKGPFKKSRAWSTVHEGNTDFIGRAPREVPVNYYPIGVCGWEDYIFVATAGGNMGGSGDAKIEKYHNLTMEKMGENVFGPFESPPGNYINGAHSVVMGLGSLWAVNSAAGKVRRINPDTMATIADITTGPACRDAWFDGKYVWSLSSTNNQIYRIDPATNLVDATINTSGTPFKGISTDTHCWVACFDGNVIRKIDPATATIVASVATSTSPNWFEYDGEYLFVACYNGDCIQAVDPTTNTVVYTVSTSGGSRPHGMKRYKEELWVACSGDHYLRIMNVNTRTFVRAIPVRQNPPALCVAADSMWHASGNENYLIRHPLETTWT